MDKKKLKVLRDIAYTFPMTCGLCSHGQFQAYHGNMPLWGTCRVHTYKHDKHTGDERQLSVHLLGGCGDFQPTDNAAKSLEGFAEFLP